MQSFGGGQATLALIRRVIVERHEWLSEPELARDLTICQVAPGMNLIAVTTLIGRRLGGVAGAVVSLLGLLLPSVTLTLLITAFWGQLRMLPGLDRALSGGIVPAVVGVGLWSSWRTGRTLADGEWDVNTPQSAQRKVRAVRWSIALVCGLLALVPRMPVFAVLLIGGIAGMLLARPASAAVEKDVS